MLIFPGLEVDPFRCKVRPSIKARMSLSSRRLVDVSSGGGGGAGRFLRPVDLDLPWSVLNLLGSKWTGGAGAFRFP